MTLVDTSVWIHYFNGKSMELLQGFRIDKEYKQALTLLDTLEKQSLLNTYLAVEYTNMYRALRKRGITIRKTTDTVIAGYCVLNDLQLLQSDRDFLPFKKYFGLKLA